MLSPCLAWAYGARYAHLYVPDTRVRVPRGFGVNARYNASVRPSVRPPGRKRNGSFLVGEATGYCLVEPEARRRREGLREEGGGRPRALWVVGTARVDGHDRFVLQYTRSLDDLLRNGEGSAGRDTF